MRYYEFSPSHTVLANTDRSRELALIAEADFIIRQHQQKMLSESIKSSLTNWFKEAAKYVSQVKTLSGKFIDRFWKLVDLVLKKLPSHHQSFVERNIAELSKALANTIKTGLDRDLINKAVKNALDRCLEQNLIDRQNIKLSFEQNQSEIVAAIEHELDGMLDSVKQGVKSDLESFSPATQDQSLAKRFPGAFRGFVGGAAFMGVFGLVDNLGMFMGMGAIEQWIIELGSNSMVAAGIGNTFSNAFAAIATSAISMKLAKLGIEGEGTITQNTIGVIAGCMIPVIILVMLQILL